MTTNVKLYGSLVGTPYNASGFPAVSNFLKDGTEHILWRDKVQFTSSNIIGDSISLAKLKSTALISESSAIWFDAFGTGVQLNIGDINYPTGLASALAIASAGNANLWKGFAAADMGYPLWQALGYSADPGGIIELLGVIANANVANTANLAWKIMGINR